MHERPNGNERIVSANIAIGPRNEYHMDEYYEMLTCATRHIFNQCQRLRKSPEALRGANSVKHAKSEYSGGVEPSKKSIRSLISQPLYPPSQITHKPLIQLNNLKTFVHQSNKPDQQPLSLSLQLANQPAELAIKNVFLNHPHPLHRQSSTCCCLGCSRSSPISRCSGPQRLHGSPSQRPHERTSSQRHSSTKAHWFHVGPTSLWDTPWTSSYFNSIRLDYLWRQAVGCGGRCYGYVSGTPSAVLHF